VSTLSQVSIRRPVATAMVFLILIVIGAVSLRNLPVDLLPTIEFTQLSVRVDYPNVGPEEIEQIITDPIENALSGLPNLERITSESEEGSSWVRLDFARGTDIDAAASDVRAAVDRLRAQLPVEAEPPEIFKLDLDRAEVVALAATSTLELEDLTRLLEDDLARRFEQIPGVGTIDVGGAIRREIKVDLDRDRLRAAGLTAVDVEEAVARENATLPGGNIRRGMSDLYVRAMGEYRSLEEIGATVVTIRAGVPIRVRDVASVRDDYEDVGFLVEVNGVPAVTLRIQKQSGANTVQVAADIREEAERLNAERDDVHFTVISDQSEFIRQSIANVRSSAIWGSLLAVAILYFFLRSSASTAIIAISIPISIVSSFGLLYFAGLTLNQMTFGGLALGVGMIVDNAIVILENIVRKREENGLAPAEAAATGAREVTGALVASTLTSCVVFLPLVFSRTTSGALFQALALVVVFSQAFSLLVAFTVVPTLAARLMRSNRALGAGTLGFTRRLERWYTGRLRWALGHRLRILAATAGLVGVAVLLWPLIPVELAPQTDADEIDVDLEMAEGTNLAVVREYVRRLETLVWEALPRDDVEFVATEVRGSNAGIELKLVPQDRRSLSSTELADDLRVALAGRVPGAEVRVRASTGLWILRRVFSAGGGEEAVEIELRGWDLAQADAIGGEIERRIENLPGITDVRLSRREGQPEERLVFDRERMAEVGLTVREVGRTVQANVGGVEASRLREGGNEYPIRVRLRPDDRFAAGDLAGISLRTPAGEVVPLDSVVSRAQGRGPVEIDRVDGQRVTYVNASLETGVPLGDAIEAIRVALADLELPAGFSIYFGGEYQEQQEARRDFVIAIAMALLLVYMLMAAQFERFLDPLIVMGAVPAALIGVVPMLLLTGTTLNMQSVMGLVMLIGLVVNNAIVLVDAINLLRREQRLSVVEAVVEAGRLRLRPILMTTSTTVLGLVPLALGLGAGAEIQAALARVVIGGMTASTLVTLLLIPVTYVSATSGMERARAWWLTLRRRPAGAEEDRPSTA
jgi:HAE1 family hydrophobic/amphiphilic exporter-1